jgi:hypothetical protein
LQTEGESVLPEDMPAFQAAAVHQPDANSLYTPPRRRAPFTPEPVVAAFLDSSDVRALRMATLQQLGLAITPAKVQRFVGQFFNGHKKLHIRDLPAEAFEKEEGVSWLIYTIAYGNHSEVNYNIEPLAGEPVELGMVRVKPFQLVKRSP